MTIDPHALAEEAIRKAQERAKPVPPISHHPNSNTYGPTVFVKEAEAKKIRLSKADFEAAMRRLFAAGKIRAESYGPPSKSYSRLVISERT
jgi:hypothetical protein